MLMLLSPAKSLDYERPWPEDLTPTRPYFTQEPVDLVDRLRTLPVQDLAQLMSISDPLASLNVARYAAWSPEYLLENARPAVMAFNGDVYEGLDAMSLSAVDWEWAQQHLSILSGLYGILRPLDLLQPYRLEMGTALANERGRNLYAFWGSRIAERINHLLQAQPGESVVLNLASQEYFKAVDRKALKARVVECVFEDYKSGRYKIISFHAKRARGLMARYVIQNRAKTPADLAAFSSEGYTYEAQASTLERMVFRRRLDS